MQKILAFLFSKKKSWLHDAIETIVVALVLALIIKATILEVFWIPSSSMEPTLNIQDRIVVNKFIYRFREPRRGEIVVFKLPTDRQHKELIKRLIGLPGDTIEMREGLIFINGKYYSENHPMFRDNDSFGPVQIPDGEYLVLGDNRPVSADGRYFGLLPRKYLVGPAFLKIWPIWEFSPLI